MGSFYESGCQPGGRLSFCRGEYSEWVPFIFAGEEPEFDDLLANLEPGAPVSQWCRGFAAGSLWLEDSWEPYMIDEMSEEMGACLMTLSFFATRSLAESIVSESENPDATLEGSAAMFRDVFPDALASYTQMGMAVRQVVQEAEAPATAVGRNAPCPCGSGKKYKRCCLPH